MPRALPATGDLGGIARLAGPTVRLTGRLPDAAVAELLRSCRALVIPGAEEFGIGARDERLPPGHAGPAEVHPAARIVILPR